MCCFMQDSSRLRRRHLRGRGAAGRGDGVELPLGEGTEHACGVRGGDHDERPRLHAGAVAALEVRRVGMREAASGH